MQITHIRVVCFLLSASRLSSSVFIAVHEMASPPYDLLAPPPATEDPSKGLNVSWKAFKENSTLAADLFTLACFLVFTFLIGSDVCRAFKKRATWLPGKAFALSGVTVQIIVWWTSLSNIYNDYEGDIEDLIDSHQLVVSGRVAVCVFIGYLLPGMTAPSVRVFGALAITICAQIASELLLLYNQAYTEPEIRSTEYGYVDLECLKNYNKEYKYGYVDQKCMKRNYSKQTTEFEKSYKKEISWSKTADLILLICIVVLGLILCCTVLASKTIRGLLRQRVSAIAEESKLHFSNERTTISSINEEIQSSNEKTKSFWNDFEGEVLRSCFVARVCQVDYVISRSVLSSAVWILVTICVIVFYKSVAYYTSDAYYTFPFLCFITMGWVIVSWRWLTAQLHCPPRHSRRRWFCFEDFWTSHIVEWIDMYDLKRERRRFQKSNSKMPSSNKSQGLFTRIFTKVRLHKLLYLVLTLQVCVVLFCKVFGLLSELTVGEFLYRCRRFVHRYRKNKMKEDLVISHENYTKSLESLCMPGEDLSFLWEANIMSLKKAECLMKKGRKEGSSSEETNSMFRQYSVQWAEDGKKILMMLKENAIPSVLSHFSSVEKHCLKMTIVSLITIYIGLHKAKSDSLAKVMKACHEVWDLVSFADECDIDLQADKINLLDDFNKESDQVCMAANREFYKLQMKYEKLASESEDNENVHGFLKDLLEKCENKLKKENILKGNSRFPRDLSDSRNWTKLVPSYALYKLCKLMLAEDIQDFVAWTEKSLRDVLACSMSKLPDMIVKQCWIWAQEFEEDKLWEAIQLAGKCRGVMEEWGQEPKPKVNTTQPKTLYQRFKMWILCRSDEEPPSQGDQTLSNTEQCTIEVKELPSQGVSTGTH